LSPLPPLAYHDRVGDPITRKIDKFFDVVDAGLDEAGHLLNRGKRAEDRAAKARYPDAIDAEFTPTPSRPPDATGMVRSRFRIIELTDAVTNKVVWVVTDGETETKCTTREKAERMRIAMEAA
jgi:hypothetical protein